MEDAYSGALAAATSFRVDASVSPPMATLGGQAKSYAMPRYAHVIDVISELNKEKCKTIIDIRCLMAVARQDTGDEALMVARVTNAFMKLKSLDTQISNAVKFQYSDNKFDSNMAHLRRCIYANNDDGSGVKTYLNSIKSNTKLQYQYAALKDKPVPDVYPRFDDESAKQQLPPVPSPTAAATRYVTVKEAYKLRYEIKRRRRRSRL
jgi:hypothetical protein